MTRLAALAGACALSLALAVPAASAADLALVIGNHDYRRAPDAMSARADAEAVAESLRQSGYEVIAGTDLTRDQMRREIARFARRLDQVDANDRVVVFYSGHALRSAGLSYLAPVDQNNRTLVEVMMDGVPLDLLLRLAGEAEGRAVVFLDGAQLDGYAPRDFAEPGLANVAPPSGVLVVSAAAPGRAIARRSAGRSSFARTVVEDFLAPGARVGRAVSRLASPAWVAGDTDSRLVLVPEGRAPAEEEPETGSAAPSAERVEARLGLTRAERREIQESLNLMGYDTRGIDGIFGPGSRGAIRGWQRHNELAATGYLTTEQVAAIRRQAAEAGTPGGGAPAESETAAERDRAYWADTGARGSARGYREYLERYPDGLYASEARRQLRRMAEAGTDPTGTRELEAWQEARDYDRVEGYEDFLARYPDGIWAPEARARLAELEGSGTPAASDPPAVEAALGLNRTDRLSLEQRLAFLGFPPGNQDGFFDADTRWAIEGYQRSRGHRPTGYLDRATVQGIVEETSDARTGIVTGAGALIDMLRGLGNQQ